MDRSRQYAGGSRRGWAPARISLIYVLIALAIGYNLAAFILGDLAWIVSALDWTSNERAALVSMGLVAASLGFLASLAHDEQ